MLPPTQNWLQDQDQRKQALSSSSEAMKVAKKGSRMRRRKSLTAQFNTG
jgi:cation transport regulator ChaB